MIDLRHLVCWTGRDAYLLVRNDADLRDDLLAIEHNRDGALDLIMYVVDALQVRRITYLVPRRKKSLESWSKAKASARYSSKLMGCPAFITIIHRLGSGNNIPSLRISS